MCAHRKLTCSSEERVPLRPRFAVMPFALRLITGGETFSLNHVFRNILSPNMILIRPANGQALFV